MIDGEDLHKIMEETFESTDELQQFLREKKVRNLRITKDDCINNYNKVKSIIGYPPTVQDMNEHGEISISTYNKRFGNFNKFKKSINESIRLDRNPSKEDLIDSLIELKNKIGKTPTLEEMKNNGISPAPYIKHFGSGSSWNDALENIGLSPTKPHSVTKKQCDDEYYRIKKALKKKPTSEDFRDHSIISSLGTIKKLYGSWILFTKHLGEYERRPGEKIPNEDLVKEYWKLKIYLREENDNNALTQKEMDDRGAYSSSVYIRRFGNWNQFLNLIGEKANQ